MTDPFRKEPPKPQDPSGTPGPVYGASGTGPGYPPPQQPSPYGNPPSYPGYGGQMGYPPVDPSAPYGRSPLTGEPYSDKQKTAAGLLQILPLILGIGGVGRLYLGYTTIGLVQLIGCIVAWIFSIVLIGIPFLIGLCIWSLVDGIMIFTGSLRDPHGRPLRD